MKKFLFSFLGIVAIVAMIMIVPACGETTPPEEPATDPTKEAIIGQWKLDSVIETPLATDTDRNNVTETYLALYPTSFQGVHLEITDSLFQAELPDFAMNFTAPYTWDGTTLSTSDPDYDRFVYTAVMEFGRLKVHFKDTQAMRTYALFSKKK